MIKLFISFFILIGCTSHKPLFDESKVYDKLPEDIIRKVIISKVPYIKQCFVNYAEDDSIHTIDIIFNISTSGNVRKPIIKKNGHVKTKKDIPQKMESCIIEILFDMKFPKHKGPQPVEVIQPLNLIPKK